MPDFDASLDQMDTRTREIFRLIVEQYLESGAPMGSRNLSRLISEKISPATVRNVMQDLERMGFLGSAHVSAGRMPTQLGLRLFVDAFLEIGKPSVEEQSALRNSVKAENQDIEVAFGHVGEMVSEITKGASLIFTQKSEAPIRHIEFLNLSAERALVILVYADGRVENRVFAPVPGQTPSAMREAANFLNNLAEGRTLREVQCEIADELHKERNQLDSLASDLIAKGLAVWQNAGSPEERLIIRGQARLLSGSEGEMDVERVRALFEAFERKRDMVELLDMTQEGEGVRIFIGSENRLFSLSDSSLVIAPYVNGEQKIIGAIGVIGPTRLNYGRIVPVVNYTARLLGKVMSNEGI